PEPEAPSRTTNSPSWIDRSTPSTACRAPKCFLRLRISIPATGGALAPGLPRVGCGIRRLRQTDRRGIDEVVRALGHLERLHDLGWRACRCRLAAGGAAARDDRNQDTRENCNSDLRDVHGFPLRTTGVWILHSERASSDGAPRASHSRNASASWARRHSSKIDSAIARPPT